MKPPLSDTSPPSEPPLPSDPPPPSEPLVQSDVPTTPPVRSRPQSEIPTTPPAMTRARAGGGSGRDSFGVAALLGAVVIGASGLVAVLCGAMAWELGGVTNPSSAGLLSVINEDTVDIGGACTGGDGAVVPIAVPARTTTLVAMPPRPLTCRFTGKGGADRATWTASAPPSPAETWVVRFTAPAAVDAASVATALSPPPVPAQAPPVVEDRPAPPGAALEAAPRVPPRSAVRRKPAAVAPSEEAAAWAEAEAAPTTPELLTPVNIEVRRSGKLKGATATLDGSTVNLPGRAAVKTGMHKLRVVKGDEAVMECTLAASGAPITVVVDPENPVCP